MAGIITRGNMIINISTEYNEILTLEPTIDNIEIKIIRSNACYNGLIKGLDLRKTKIETISNDAFFQCTKLTYVYFNEELKSIGGNAFFRSNISDIKIPINLVNFNAYAFNQSPNINNIEIDDNNPMFTVRERCLFRKEEYYLVMVPRNITSTDEIPDFEKITGIGEYAFTFCLLKSFIGSPQLANISKLGFHVMQEITLIDLSRTKVEMIFSRTFRTCFAKQIFLPRSVKFIEESAFSNAVKLTTLMLHYPLESIGELPFENCPNLRSIYYFGPTNFSSNYTFSLNPRTKIYVTNIYPSDLFDGRPVIRKWPQNTYRCQRKENSFIIKCAIFIIMQCYN